ncbi:hypothetical protein MAIT1_04555 [Magnetofaba australis IT-1]|uniref:DNA primase/polymerase bifunctional N-terminal domain-containing protein n=2 Tax=Magnetofaba TaxID=1472292 RepID=A0A1Y2KAD6_9PROT|nr:DUF3987 domain-containing protein [Magnetofaba australis]OSM07678.1 hypothetical protein MAIT1_04555 [Magnetofaba australis IT-1]
MHEYGDRLLANGYPILPIMPGEKKPGRFQRGQWVDYPGWTKHGERGATDIELAAWKGWPEAGIGIAGGFIVGVDIDIADDAGLSDRIQALAFETLGQTPAIRIGRPPKRMLVYRTATPFKGIKAHPLEVLCQGQQFVAYAIHPETGQPYQWPVRCLTEIVLEELPETSETEVRRFLEQALAMLPQEMRPKRTVVAHPMPHAAHAGEAYAEAALRGEVAKVASAPPGCRNDTLNTAAFALGTLIGSGQLPQETAESRLMAAAMAAGLTEREARATIASGINAGVSHPREVAASIPRLAGPHPAQRLIDQAGKQQPAQEEQVQAFPDPGFDPLDVDGVLKELIDYMLATATRPQPVLALGNALCALGAIMGRRYRTETNLRTNLYVVGIADSGSGKNHSREIINELFMEAGLGRFLGGHRIASGAGLLNAIHQQPAILFQQDEFGMFLHAAADRRRSPRHITDILDIMTEMFTAAGSLFLGTEYAGRDGKNPRKDINQPCLCIYGTTTPNHFWNALQSANVGDGSLARFIILQTEDDYPEENRNRAVRETPASLMEGIKRIADGGKPGEGNLAGMLPGPETAVNPMTATISPQARELFRSLSDEVTERLRQARGTPYTSVLSRIGENAAKIALVRAVSFDPEQPVIREADASWAIRLVQHSVATVIEQVERHVADNQVEHNHKRVLEIIRKSGAGGINRSQLCRKSRFLTKRERDEILSELVEAGDVLVWTQPSGTPKPITLYTVAESEMVDGNAP